MSALDKLSSYKATIGAQTETPSQKEKEQTFMKRLQLSCSDQCEAVFLSAIHNSGFKMYDVNGNFTELHTTLTTSGNQRVQAIAGSGKALRNGTKVMTPEGNVSIERLHVGSEVFGEDGKPHEVVGVFPQGRKEPYEIRFSNGEIRECCSEHLWTLVDTDTGEIVTKTTLEWMDSGYEDYILPPVSPVEYSEGIRTRDSVMRSLIENIIPNDYSVPSMVCLGSARLRKEFLMRYCDNNGHIFSLCKLYSTLGLYLIQEDDETVTVSTELRIVSIKKSDKKAVPMTCISVDSESQLFLLEGGIPTHNTTMLIFKIMHDIVTGEIMRLQTLPNGAQVRVVNNVFVGTFLKSGADELHTRLAQCQRRMGYTVTADGIHFGTLHAEFKRCLNAMGIATPIASQQVLSGMFRKAVNVCSITREGENLKNEDYKIIESIVTYYRGRLDNKRYMHPSASEYGLDMATLDLLNTTYANLRKAEGVMDFEDLQELLYKYLYVTPNQNVIEFVASRYNYMYLDEFQDTSQIQYAILKVYARGWLRDTEHPTKGKIVVVGDVQQCIYSFRGSCIEVMHQYFNEDFEAVNNTLSYNYRCPANILNPVVSSISLNLESKGINILPFRDGGEFKSVSCTSLGGMLTYVEQELEKDLRDGRNIAILCRTNYDGMLPALYLEMKGRYRFSISGEGMTLNTALPRRLIRVARLFTDRCSVAIKDVLGMLVPYTVSYKVRRVYTILKDNNLSIWAMDRRDLKWECQELYENIELLEAYKKQHNNSDVETLKYLYRNLITDQFSGDSVYAESARSCIQVLLHFLNTCNFETVHEFLEEMDELGERLEARVGKKCDISIATVHEFKGKERDSIYVWNDSDMVFPSPKINPENYEDMSEERRVHYIACTRARHKSTILSLAGKVGTFLQEMDCKTTPFVNCVQGSLSGGGSTSGTETAISEMDVDSESTKELVGL